MSTSRNTRRTIGGVLLVAAVAALTFAVLAFVRGGWGSGGDEPTPGPTYRFATQRHVNEEGGYSFHHPPSWNVQDQGTVSTVDGPRGDTRVTFGLGAEGTVEEAETAFVRELQQRYRGVELAALQVERVGPHPALSVAGSGRNAEGVRLRFLAITVGVGGTNYSIGVFTAADSEPGGVVPPTQEIVNSFRPLPPEQDD